MRTFRHFAAGLTFGALDRLTMQMRCPRQARAVWVKLLDALSTSGTLEDDDDQDPDEKPTTKKDSFLLQADISHIYLGGEVYAYRIV